MLTVPLLFLASLLPLISSAACCSLSLKLSKSRWLSWCQSSSLQVNKNGVRGEQERWMSIVCTRQLYLLLLNNSNSAAAGSAAECTGGFIHAYITHHQGVWGMQLDSNRSRGHELCSDSRQFVGLELAHGWIKTSCFDGDRNIMRKQ